MRVTPFLRFLVQKKNTHDKKVVRGSSLDFDVRAYVCLDVCHCHCCGRRRWKRSCAVTNLRSKASYSPRKNTFYAILKRWKYKNPLK